MRLRSFGLSNKKGQCMYLPFYFYVSLYIRRLSSALVQWAQLVFAVFSFPFLYQMHF